jgi:triacylglycerol lipase
MIMSNYNFQAKINDFDPGTTRYTGDNAFFLADCAKLAYEDQASIKQVMKDEMNFDNFKFFGEKTGGTQAFIVGNDKMIVVSFRGTEKKIDDLITDVKFKLDDAKLKPEDDLVGKVHRGFQDALHEVWGDELGNEDMRLYIKQIQDNQQTIWFCGHSLGAALATLAAAEYVLKDNNKDGSVVNGIYTIGSPRVGNDEFAEGFDAVLADKCFRFVNNNDVVTQNPLPGLVFKYTHVGQQLYIDSDGILRPSIPWWKKAWDRWNGIKKDISINKVGLDAFKDHGSEGYVSLIKNNKDVRTPWS